MNKTEAIEKMNNMEADIAEVICDISRNGVVCYSNESVLVFLVSQPSNDDLIRHNKHWTICDNVEDFTQGMVYGEKEAKEKYSRYYVSDFKEVKEFVSDYETIKPKN